MALNTFRIKADLQAQRDGHRLWLFISFCLCAGAGALLALYGV